MSRLINFDNLPKIRVKRNGKEVDIIDWRNSPGNYVTFDYEGIKGSFLITKFDKGIVTITSPEFGMKSFYASNLYKCALGEYVGRFTTRYKINVGDVFNDNGRQLLIIDRKVEASKQKRFDRARGKSRTINKNEKYYLYHCKKDGYEGWITESNLLKGVGCAFCGGAAVIVGKNDLATTHPNLVKYLMDPDEATKYSAKSHRSIWLHCEYCGAKIQKTISDFTRRGFLCPVCSDGFSYPEKIIFSMLTQIKEEFIYQLSSKTFSWVGSFRYDFYLRHQDAIIEVHGDQHYRLNNRSFWGRDDKENDKIKKDLAIRNGISKYIVIDARKSELDYIKKNILKSDLSSILPLEKVDWLECERYSRGNRVYDVCLIKANDNNLTTGEISKKTGIEQSVVRDYLRRGSKIGWCEYDPLEEMRRSAAKNHPRKPIVVLDASGRVLGHYSSTMALEKESVKKYGFKMHFSEVAARVNPKSSKYGLPYHEYYIKEDD